VSPYPAWPFLSDPQHPFLSAVWAVLIHGVLGVFVLAPLIWRGRHRASWAACAFAGGSILDLDHFIAAGSLSLHRIETLPGGRPDTHSLAFVLLLSLVVLVLWPGRWKLAAAWSCFAVNTGHLLFDGAGANEHLLYPWTSSHGIPSLLVPTSTSCTRGPAATGYRGCSARSELSPSARQASFSRDTSTPPIGSAGCRQRSRGGSRRIKRAHRCVGVGARGSNTRPGGSGRRDNR
jgi:hypothetical protein